MVNAPFFDLKEGSTNQNVLSTLITFTIPTGKPVRLVDFSLSPDSNFINQGSFTIFWNGRNDITTPQRLRNSFDLPLDKFRRKVMVDGKEQEGAIFLPGEKIEINAKANDGTTTVLLSAMLLGEVLE